MQCMKNIQRIHQSVAININKIFSGTSIESAPWIARQKNNDRLGHVRSYPYSPRPVVPQRCHWLEYSSTKNGEREEGMRWFWNRLQRAHAGCQATKDANSDGTNTLMIPGPWKHLQPAIILKFKFSVIWRTPSNYAEENLCYHGWLRKQLMQH